ncbi:hypothetical protein NECAME_13721 [Necator americanus]|uniref:Uncharacterized protein n=1 Tax=Necator americanus TaxID=51031 RepID=W2SVX4_NECAM|nr:hypothetical protein NECAME_13721 [Necator americanus]ETN72847.1 hypothetical protein NECAME_13721 [Necator americanus]
MPYYCLVQYCSSVLRTPLSEIITNSKNTWGSLNLLLNLPEVKCPCRRHQPKAMKAKENSCQQLLKVKKVK